MYERHQRDLAAAGRSGFGLFQTRPHRPVVFTDLHGGGVIRTASHRSRFKRGCMSQPAVRIQKECLIMFNLSRKPDVMSARGAGAVLFGWTLCWTDLCRWPWKTIYCGDQCQCSPFPGATRVADWPGVFRNSIVTLCCLCLCLPPSNRPTPWTGHVPHGSGLCRERCGQRKRQSNSGSSGRFEVCWLDASFCRF